MHVTNHLFFGSSQLIVITVDNTLVNTRNYHKEGTKHPSAETC